MRNRLSHICRCIISENAPADDGIADEAGGDGDIHRADGGVSLFGRKASGYDIVYVPAAHRYHDAVCGKRSVFVPEFGGSGKYAVLPVGAFRRGNLTSRDVYVD